MPRKNRRIVASQARAAELIGVSRRTIAEWLSQGCPGKHGRYDVDAIETWREARNPPDRPDPLLAGPTSPSLERYRESRAKLADLDYRKRVGELIDVTEMHERHVRMSNRLRQAGELLGRKCGVEAQMILEEALQDLEREFFTSANSVDQ